MCVSGAHPEVSLVEPLVAGGWRGKPQRPQGADDRASPQPGRTRQKCLARIELGAAMGGDGVCAADSPSAEAHALPGTPRQFRAAGLCGSPGVVEAAYKEECVDIFVRKNSCAKETLAIPLHRNGISLVSKPRVSIANRRDVAPNPQAHHGVRDDAAIAKPASFPVFHSAAHHRADWLHRKFAVTRRTSGNRWQLG